MQVDTDWFRRYIKTSIKQALVFNYCHRNQTEIPCIFRKALFCAPLIFFHYNYLIKFPRQSQQLAHILNSREFLESQHFQPDEKFQHVPRIPEKCQNPIHIYKEICSKFSLLL
ncbi:unnamed protein product [Rhizophagus irregularis]|nr:unnamed protein product [Rhizophagus irregularis]CAB5344144.1 unnamed protein product [Rhizophagus irregularis]